MKKLITAIIAVIMCFSLVAGMTSCTPEQPAVEDTKAQTAAPAPAASTAPAETPTEAPTDAPTEAPTEAPATDPVTEAPQTKAPETEDPNVTYYEDIIDLFERTSEAEHVAIDADNGKELACRFSIEKGSRLTGLIFEAVPSWMTKGESAFVVELYKWDSDYDTTLTGDILYSETFEEWIDNAKCEVYFDVEKGYPSGTYLWVFRGLTNKIGIWAMEPLEECEYYINGIECNNGYRVEALVNVPN